VMALRNSVRPAEAKTAEEAGTIAAEAWGHRSEDVPFALLRPMRGDRKRASGAFRRCGQWVRAARPRSARRPARAALDRNPNPIAYPNPPPLFQFTVPFAVTIQT
jgi:hypothetical protein